MCVQGGGTGDDWVFVCGESGVHLVREGRSGTIPYIPYHTIPYPIYLQWYSQRLGTERLGLFCKPLERLAEFSWYLFKVEGGLIAFLVVWMPLYRAHCIPCCMDATVQGGRAPSVPCIPILENSGEAARRRRGR